MTALTLDEAGKLANAERTINDGLRTFYSVGLALTLIRDAKLYRADYKSFESYCAERWGFKRSYAARLIQASEVAGSLKLLTNGQLPTSERQVRPLIGHSPEMQADVWDQAHAESDSPSGRRVKELLTKALDGLSPEEKQAVIEREEKAVIGRYQDRADRDQFAERNARCRRLHKRLTKEVAGYGDGAASALEILDSLGQELELLAG